MMKKILNKVKAKIGKKIKKLLLAFDKNIFIDIPDSIKNHTDNCKINENVKIYEPYHIIECTIEKGTYIARNSFITKTNIGKFCSIGPNLLCGFGIHPTNGISTSPSFYSTMNQNGITYAEFDKIEERKIITIGNDVFIGMNVTILDGVTIGDGAIIAAGAVVTKDVKPYEIVGGVPAKHIKFRFSEDTINKLLEIKWWNFNDKELKDVEKMFFDIEGFLRKYKTD